MRRMHLRFVSPAVNLHTPPFAIAGALYRLSRQVFVALMLAAGSHAVSMTECGDGIDNDSDSFIDLDDFDCVDSDDDSESSETIFIDGFEN